MTVPAGADPGLPRWVEAPLAAAGLLALAPLLAVLALLVKATSPGPALYRQTRVGRGGRPFTLIKLRSMREEVPGTEVPGTEVEVPEVFGTEVTAAGDARITAVGRLLRRTKLDELPELWNVLAGELSFVGPRPEVARYVDLEDPRWRAVLAVRPGLTDQVTLRLRDEESLLAGVDGDPETFYRRQLVPYKLEAYAASIARRSPWRDVAIIVRTVLAIIGLGRPAPVTVAEVAQARRV